MLNECPGLPIIETLYEATGSKAGTVFMMLCIYVIIGASQFNILASVSRLAWAFAKDGGLPFSHVSTVRWALLPRRSHRCSRERVYAHRRGPRPFDMTFRVQP